MGTITASLDLLHLHHFARPGYQRMPESLSADAADLADWKDQRNEVAFSRLIQRHAALVAGVCRRRLDGIRADEAAQAVFIILARRAHNIDDVSRLAAWLHGVAIRVCNETKRADSRRAHHERAASTLGRLDGDEDEAVWSDLRPHLDEAIAALSPPQRAVVIGHFLEGHTQTAVAKQLGISEDAAHQRLHYALTKLRSWFGSKGLRISALALATGLAHESTAAESTLIAACTHAALHPASATPAATLAASTSTGLSAAIAFPAIMGGILTAGLAGWLMLGRGIARPPMVLFHEGFEHLGGLTNGWYDHITCPVSVSGGGHESLHAAEFRFRRDDETPLAAGTARRMFAATDALRIGYWVRYSSHWALRGKPYLVVQCLVMTTADGRFDAPSNTHLTCALGIDQGTPFVSLQDARNLDVTKIGQDLSDISEARAIAGGNGGDGGYFRRSDGTWGNAPMALS